MAEEAIADSKEVLCSYLRPCGEASVITAVVKGSAGNTADRDDGFAADDDICGAAVDSETTVQTAGLWKAK